MAKPEMGKLDTASRPQSSKEESAEDEGLALASKVPEKALEQHHCKSKRLDGRSVQETYPQKTMDPLLHHLEQMEARHRRQLSAYEEELKEQQKHTRYMIRLILAISILLLLYRIIQAYGHLREANILKEAAMRDSQHSD
jgi:hypothetical protein